MHEATDTGLRWAQAARAARWALNNQIHALGDGAPWIAEPARLQFRQQGRSTVDRFHVYEYLAAAPDPANTKGFVAPLREALRASDRPSVLATLRPRSEHHEVPDQNAPVRAALRYLENRTDQLDYARALALDLPRRSGLIESGHRHVRQARLKQAAAWWTEANARALRQLRTLRANLRRDDYWTRN